MISSLKRLLKKESVGITSPSPALLRSSPSAKNNGQIKDASNKTKTFSATTGAKYAIILGDEGAILIYVVGKVVQSRNFIAHANTENLKEFESILSKNTKAPIFMIIDSMDQSFIQQSLPPISPLGVKKLIKRRLDRDLGADVIKGYVLLERDETGRRDWNFLMVSLENNPNLNLWFEFVERVENRLSGIYLLSVEAENIVKNIDIAIGLPRRSKKNPTGSEWKFFVTHNKVGGFRQVILKDGRIIFTRLTQPVGEVTTDVIAGNIEQEMMSTVEYMKRLTFNPQQGLDIYIVASSDINKSLDVSRISAANVFKFTPFEVAEFFGISGAAQSSDQFGDVIMAAYIACSKVHRLVLTLPKALKVNQLYNFVKYQRTFAGLAVLGMIVYSGILTLGLMNKYSEIENLEQRKIIQQRKLDEINQDIKKSGIDIQKVSDTVLLYNQLISEAHSPLPLLARLRAAIMAPIVMADVFWQGPALDTSGAISPESTAKGDSVLLVLRFPEVSGTDEAFKSVAKKVLLDVRAAFPEYEVVYTKLPDAISKKSEAGEITFDDKDALIEIDNASLEATLSLIKKSGNEPPQAAPPAGGPPSTDELLGVRRP